MKVGILILGLLFQSACLFAAESSDPVFEQLAKTKRFAFGGTGYGGTISQGEKDYCEILARRSALSDFERLLTSGNPQAQCYALVGIQALDPAKFEKLSAAYFKKRTEVSTIHGCMSGKEPMSRILKEIKAGEYKPSDPAFARLTQAKQFVFGERGEAPDISQEQKDYNEILARPTALKDFQRLLLFENPHAQCYALQGIQVLDPGKFEKLSLRYAKDERLVTIRSGCELDKEPMTRIIKEIKAGKYKPKEKAKP